MLDYSRDFVSHAEDKDFKVCLTSLAQLVTQQLPDMNGDSEGDTDKLQLKNSVRVGEDSMRLYNSKTWTLVGIVWKIEEHKSDFKLKLFDFGNYRLRIEGQIVVRKATNEDQAKLFKQLVHEDIKEWQDAFASADRTDLNNGLKQVTDKVKPTIDMDGTKYERELWDLAKEYAKSGGQISYKEAKSLCFHALDGARVTNTEKRTLKYIMDEYKLTPKAEEFFQSFCGAAKRPEPKAEREREDAKSSETPAKKAKKTAK